MSVRVFLVDDHEIVRRGIRGLVESEGDLDVVGEAASVAEALARVPAARPNVAVLDVRLPHQERVVLELIGEGLTNRQISERMFLTEKTVKNYVSHLLSKLGMQRRTQIAVLATELRRDVS